MGKVTKKVLFGLIIIALALPMFVGCEPDTPAEPPATNYKAEFLSLLKTKVNESGVATLAISGENLTVVFTGEKTLAQIKTAAETLVTKFQEETSAGTDLKIVETTYTLATLDAAGLTALKEQVASLADNPISYLANVVYKSNTFTLQGTVEFGNIPD